jgi:cytidylate kinase
VAISETVGSMGIEIGRKLAESLGWEFADREILSKASEQFGEDVTNLRHSVEEKPTLWERFSDTQHRYKAYVEAIMLEMAARDNVALAGRSSTIVLRPVPHVVPVRTAAPERARAQRLENEMGLTHEAALNFVRHSDRERAARVKFLYQLDVDDPLLYDLVLNSERLTVEKGAALIRETLRDERFQSIEAGRREVVDLSLAALARATLMAHPQVEAHGPHSDMQGRPRVVDGRGPGARAAHRRGGRRRPDSGRGQRAQRDRRDAPRPDHHRIVGHRKGLDGPFDLEGPVTKASARKGSQRRGLEAHAGFTLAGRVCRAGGGRGQTLPAR